MAQSIIARCAGLATDPSPLITGPEGGLRVADNVLIDRPGVARQRPGLGAGTTHTTDNLPRRMHAYNGTSITVSEWDGDIVTPVWAVRARAASSPYTVPTGGAEPLSYTESFPQFAEARRNLYWSSKIGPLKICNVADSAAVLAGMHEAPSGTFSTATSGAVAIPNNTARAWRWCFVKRDANGVVVRSAPSPWTSYDNTTGGTIDMNWIVPLPTYAVANDEIELYATQTVASGTTPSDMMYLSKRQTITSGDITAGYVTVKDSRTDDQLGGELYTNPTREGLLKSNYRPPACGALAFWSECLWFGRCIGPWTTAIEIVSVTGVTSTDGGAGLQRLELAATATSGSDTLTGLASTTSVVVGQLVTDGGVPGASSGTIPIGTTVLSKTGTTVRMSANATASGAVTAYFHDVVTVDGQAYYASSSTSAGGTYPRFLVSAADPERTARELAACISETSTTVFAYAIEDPFAPTDVYGNATKGTIVIRSVALDDSQWTVTSTRDGALSYQVNSSGAALVARDDRPHSLFYSKPGEPEHVPEINFLTIGSEAYPILALAPLRAALLVFKTDGIYRVTGTAPDGWRVDLLDPTLRPLRAECVDVIGGTAVAWTQHGVVLVDEGGVRNISEGLIGEDLEAGAARVLDIPLTTGAWVSAWNREGLVLVGVPGGLGSDDADEVFCYSMNTGAWTRWTLDLYCAAEARVDGAMYAAKSARGDWEVASLRGSWLSEVAYTGYDASHSISGWTYTVNAGVATVEFATANAPRWTPEVDDWVSGTVSGSTEWRRVTAVSLDGSDYTLTLESEFSDIPTAARTGYEHFDSVIEWQSLTPGSPALDAVWRELQVSYDWSRYAGTVGGTAATMEIGGHSNTQTTSQMVEWTATREASLSNQARVMVDRDLARCAHLYPRVETSDIGLDWRILGVSAVYESTSERTRR